MSNYAEECLKKYVKLRQTFKVQIRFEICYYYDESEYFSLSRTIRNLNRYLQKCNMNLHWRTFATVGIDNLIEPNDTEIFFNRPIKRLTRLDIKKR